MAPPSKGTRARLNLRVPLVVYLAVTRAAARDNMTLNDWACTVLARAAEEPPRV